MTMNADRKLISQPSVDSENNERVTSERVGSLDVFHVYRPELISNERKNASVDRANVRRI